MKTHLPHQPADLVPPVSRDLPTPAPTFLALISPGVRTSVPAGCDTGDVSTPARGVIPVAAGIVALFLMVGCDAEGIRPVPGSPTPPATSRTPESATLDCAESIDLVVAPPDDFTVVLGSIALSLNTPLEASPSGLGVGPTRLFAKSGLLVRSGVAARLSLYGSWTERARIGWGAPPRAAVTVVVPPCPADPAGWLVFSGGYWVDEPGCVGIELWTGAGTQRVSIGVGRSCSG